MAFRYRYVRCKTINLKIYCPSAHRKDDKSEGLAEGKISICMIANSLTIIVFEKDKSNNSGFKTFTWQKQYGSFPTQSVHKDINLANNTASLTAN